MEDSCVFPDLIPSLLPLFVNYGSLVAHTLLESATDPYMMSNDIMDDNVIGNFCDIFNSLCLCHNINTLGS